MFGVFSMASDMVNPILSNVCSVRKEPFVIARLGTKIAEVVDPTGCEGYPGTGNLERVCVCLCFFVQL